jgi:hypothetical protein
MSMLLRLPLGTEHFLSEHSFAAAAAVAACWAVHLQHHTVSSYSGPEFCPALHTKQSSVSEVLLHLLVSAGAVPAAIQDRSGHACLLVLPSDQPSNRKEALAVEELLAQLLQVWWVVGLTASLRALETRATAHSSL